MVIQQQTLKSLKNNKNMKNLNLIFIVLLFFNCSGSSDDGDDNVIPPAPATPIAAALTFPANNQECNEGTSVGPTQSSVTFTWEASANTDSYTIVVKSLNNNSSITLNANTNEKNITINKGTPYSWYVISKSTSTTETAQSETWKFYNSGDATESHAPFPVDLDAPSMGANLSGITTVSLAWTGNDIDDDITGYNIYFDTTSPPTTSLGDSQTTTTIDVDVIAGNAYYWRVITTDAEGNNSESEIFEFRVD